MHSAEQALRREHFHTRYHDLLARVRTGVIPWEVGITQAKSWAAQFEAKRHWYEYGRLTNFIGACYAQVGRLNESRRWYGLAARAFEVCGEHSWSISARMNDAYSLSQTGDYRACYRMLKQLYDEPLCTPYDRENADLVCFLLIHQAQMLIWLGERAEAQALLQLALQQTHAQGISAHQRGNLQSMAYIELAQSYVCAGDIASAAPHLADALAAAEQAGPSEIGSVYQALGSYQAYIDVPDSAIATGHFDRARASFFRTQEINRIADTDYLHGWYLLRTGDRARARQQFQSALQLYSQRGIAYKCEWVVLAQAYLKGRPASEECRLAVMD